MKMVSHLDPELPPIAMIERDYEQLNRLASAAARNHPRTADFLAREIARADIVPDIGERPGLVTMGSQVLFRDDETGKTRWVTLVFPQDADVSEGRISVLTPIGAALIGLSVSQSITFETPAGIRRSLSVLAVRTPA